MRHTSNIYFDRLSNCSVSSIHRQLFKFSMQAPSCCTSLEMSRAFSRSTAIRVHFFFLSIFFSLLFSYSFALSLFSLFHNHLSSLVYLTLYFSPLSLSLFHSRYIHRLEKGVETFLTFLFSLLTTAGSIFLENSFSLESFVEHERDQGTNKTARRRRGYFGMPDKIPSILPTSRELLLLLQRFSSRAY